MKKFFASLFITLVALVAPLAALASGGDVIEKFFGGVPGNNEFSGVVALPDGKFVAVGYARFNGVRQLVAVRYVARGLSNTSSPVDTTFGDQGVAKANFGVDVGGWWRAALQGDGKIVAAGTVGANMALARFNADGSLDPTFGNGGIVTVAGVGGALAIALAPGGQIYAGGGSLGNNPAMFVARFNADGTLDSTYGTGGVATAAVDSSTSPSRGNYLHSLYLLADGRLIFGGEYASRPRGTRYGRLLPTGAFDATFNGGVPLEVPNFQGAWEIAAQSTGRLVVAGSAAVTGGTTIAALRMDIDGHLDSTFGNGGIATIDGDTSAPDSLAAGTGIAVQSTDRIVVFGTQSQGSFGTRGYAGRLNTDGSADSTFRIGVSGNHYVGTAGFAMARFADDRLAVVGRYEIQAFGNTSSYKDMDAVVDKLETTGEWGNDFHWTQTDGGIPLIVDLGTARGVVTAAARQADGHIVVVGEVTEEAQGPFVIRFNPDGTQDTAYTWRWPPSYKINAVAIDGSDQPVFAGSFRQAGPPDRPWIRRGTSVATLNVVFPGSTDGALQSIAFQPDGKIVGAGWQASPTFKDALFVRITSGGGIDNAFGFGNGTMTVAASTGDDVINQVVLQPDGKIVGAGWGNATSSQDAFSLVRLNADGTLDTTFAGSGHSLYASGTMSMQANAVAIQSDGKIVAGGKAFNGTTDDMALLRVTATGGLDAGFGGSGFVVQDFGNHNRIRSLAILGNGKITAGGENGGTYGAAQWLPNGLLDTSFGNGGSVFVSMSGQFIDTASTLIVAPDHSLYLAGHAAGEPAIAHLAGDTGAAALTPTVNLSSSKNPSNTGESVTFTASVSGSGGTPTGSVDFLDNGTAISGCSARALTGGSATCTTSALVAGSHPVTAQYSGDGVYAGATSGVVTQTVNPATQPGTGQAALSPTSVDFSTVSVGTTSTVRDVTLSNTGTASLSISSIAVTAQFAQTNDCASSLAPSSSCTIHVTFTPAATSGAVNSDTAVTGTLSVQSDAANGTVTASLSGTAEKSLVQHFYQSVLRRQPDAAGHDFWAGQAQAAIDRGQNVNEVWYAMAASFFVSAEYRNFNRDDDGFITDVYLTFFNRDADSGGRAFWKDQLAQGIPREAMLVNFMFSDEFRNFTQANFGNTAARAEVDMAGDFYRGLLARLPDDGGFAYWVGRFRNAQCQGASAVTAEAEAISQSFVASSEYAARTRSNADFVADLYDAFMRRGPDANGMNYWVGELQSGHRTRDDVRHQFTLSPEFSSRVNAVANQGCLR